jgi:hypothetical protein
MTAEEYFDKNHIASKSHLGEHGLVYEEREVYKIMEAYHQQKLAERIPSDEEIEVEYLEGVLDLMSQSEMDDISVTDHIFKYNEWLKNKILNNEK